MDTQIIYSPFTDTVKKQLKNKGLKFDKEEVKLIQENSKELKKMILDEMKFRQDFRNKRKELEKMVDPISKHVRLCCEWWEKNLPNAKEIAVIMNNGTTLKLTKPTLEKCSVESYLPFGIDFSDFEVIDFN